MNYVYGGSFNPPTNAHKKIIEKLMELGDCEHIIVLPVGDDYHKPYLAPFKNRYDMLKLMLKAYDNVIISTLELDNKYKGSLHSLNELSKTYTNLSFVIGSDQLETLNEWIEYEKLLELYPFVILQRDKKLTKETIEKQFGQIKHEFKFIEFNEEVSSTEARLNKQKRDEFLDKAVIKYIDDHQLYKE